MYSSRRRTSLGAIVVALALSGLAIADEPGVQPIAIGILAGTTPSDHQLISGAQRAAASWSSRGGISGRSVRIVLLEPAKPWRDGAGRVARLVFEQDLVALIGPTDAAGAHVAAQIATLVRVPLIVLSPEDSLTQAFDPWIFRGLPGDRAQARSVLRGAFDDSSGKRVAIAVPGGRDGRERLRAVRDACAELGVVVDAVVRIDDALSFAGLDALLVWLDPEPATRLFERVPLRWDGLLLGSTRLYDGPAAAAARRRSLRLMVPESGAKPGEFHESLGYDLVDAMLAAAEGTDGSPAEIREALGDGTIRFDARGNRLVLEATVELSPATPETADGRPTS